MKPSEKTRNIALFVSSYRYIKMMWIGVAIIVTVFAIPFMIFMGNGFDSTATEILFTVGAVILFDAFLFGIAFVIIRGVHKTVEKNLVYPPANTQNRLNLHDLCEEALAINDKNTPLFVETHEAEGWIDVTWRWKDSIDFNRGVEKNVEVFYKFFKINDDFTYQEVDMITSSSVLLSPVGLRVGKNMHIGRLRNREFQITVGIDSADGPGVHRYSMNSDTLANFMHKWLADRGYRYRE